MIRHWWRKPWKSVQPTRRRPGRLVSPMLSGVEENVIAHFAAAGVRKTIVARETFHSIPQRATDPGDTFRMYYGPTMMHSKRLKKTAAPKPCT